MLKSLKWKNLQGKSPKQKLPYKEMVERNIEEGERLTKKFKSLMKNMFKYTDQGENDVSCIKKEYLKVM